MREFATAFGAVIVANGTFPEHEVPLGILHNASHVVACDGAVIHYPQAEVVIGDGDSVPEAFRDRLIQVTEQEDNDLTKATRYCLSRGWRRIAYIATTGKREDHTIGNISLLMRYYRDMGIEGIIFTDYGYFTPVRGDHTFQSHPGQQVSIFNFDCTAIASDGLKWDSYAYREWWQGSLNQALTDHFTLRADGYYMVYQTYEKKNAG
ncbi:MAG: thiamine diphosphokinase [Prevotella sp.]|nr:thiamine diphosphokinase [Prevotella sp.]